MTSDGPALTTKPMCQRCIEDIQKKLDQLPVYLGILGQFKARSPVPQSSGTRVGGSSTPSAPLNVHIVDLVDETNEILEWVGNTRIEDLIYRPDELHVVWRDGWVEVPLDGVHLAMTVSRVWGKVESAVGFGKTWERRAAGCPRCKMRTLGNWHGEDVIQCSGCGYQMSRSEYSKECLVQERGV